MALDDTEAHCCPITAPPRTPWASQPLSLWATRAWCLVSRSPPREHGYAWATPRRALGVAGARWCLTPHTAPVPDADLTVRLSPRAKRNAILDLRDGVLRVSVAAAPVEGAANAALCKLIAKRAGVARGRVSVVRGERSREKVVRVEGLHAEELRRALGVELP
jgi:uncharacterized protein